jgi:hypothetical protein
VAPAERKPWRRTTGDGSLAALLLTPVRNSICGHLGNVRTETTGILVRGEGAHGNMSQLKGNIGNYLAMGYGK